MPSYRNERKNRELKKLFRFLLVPRSVVELLQIQVKRCPPIATCEHSHRQQTLTFKILLLQHTKGRTVTRTQKPMLKIQAIKKSWPLERHASQQKKQCPQPSALPPTSCWHEHPRSCWVIHTGNRPILGQQRKWFVSAQAPSLIQVTTWLHKHLCQQKERGRSRNKKSSWSQTTGLVLKATEFKAIVKTQPKTHTCSTVGS